MFGCNNNSSSANTRLRFDGLNNNDGSLLTRNTAQIETDNTRIFAGQLSEWLGDTKTQWIRTVFWFSREFFKFLDHFWDCDPVIQTMSFNDVP
jgi:hypothetical protein